jgi:hypothetical protein
MSIPRGESLSSALTFSQIIIIKNKLEVRIEPPASGLVLLYCSAPLLYLFPSGSRAPRQSEADGFKVWLDTQSDKGQTKITILLVLFSRFENRQQ